MTLRLRVSGNQLEDPAERPLGTAEKTLPAVDDAQVKVRLGIVGVLPHDRQQELLAPA